MNDHVSASKANQRVANGPSQTSSAGENAVTANPPSYGIDFVDRALAIRTLGTESGSRAPGPAADPIQPRYDAAALTGDGLGSLVGEGARLPASLRAEIEARFGADFSGVRVHDYPAAHSLAQGRLARAFTVGSDIVFNEGRYQWCSDDGRRLLAHELAHVVQQQNRDLTGKPAGRAHEVGADAVAQSFVTGSGSVPVGPGATVGVQCEPLSQSEPTLAESSAAAKLVKVRRLADRLAQLLEASKQRRYAQEKLNTEQEGVSWFSEVIGGGGRFLRGKGWSLNLPEDSIWIPSNRALAEVEVHLAVGNVIPAARALQILSFEYTKAQTELNEYIEDVVGGAESATTGLEAAAKAGAIAAIIATGGAAAASGGVLFSASAAAYGAGMYGVYQETATQGGEMIAGSRNSLDFDPEAAARRGVKDATMAFIGTLAGGVFARWAASYFGRILMSRLAPGDIAKVAEGLGIVEGQVTPQVFLSTVHPVYQFLVDFLSGAATAPITSAAEVVLSLLEGQKAPPSKEEFWKMVVDNAVNGGLIQLFLAPFTHGSLLRARSGPSSLQGAAKGQKGSGPLDSKTVEPAMQQAAPVEPTGQQAKPVDLALPAPKPQVLQATVPAATPKPTSEVGILPAAAKAAIAPVPEPVPGVHPTETATPAPHPTEAPTPAAHSPIDRPQVTAPNILESPQVPTRPPTPRIMRSPSSSGVSEPAKPVPGPSTPSAETATHTQSPLTPLRRAEFLPPAIEELAPSPTAKGLPSGKADMPVVVSHGHEGPEPTASLAPVTPGKPRMGTVSDGVEQAPSAPVVERAPVGRRVSSVPAQASTSPTSPRRGPIPEPTAPRRSTSGEIAEVMREETSTTPEAERAEFAAKANDVRELINPRTSGSTSGPKRAQAAEEAAETARAPVGDESDVTTVPDEVPKGGYFDDPNALPGTPAWYKRPTGYPEGMRDDVWRAAAGLDGIVRDPVTNKPMNPNQPWHMGHKPDHEFWRLQRSAAERGITREAFRNEYYNDDHFRPELPESNVSHAGESQADYEDP